MKTTASRHALAWAGLALCAATLACGPLESGPDTVATVNAVSTSVQQTLAADSTNATDAVSTAAATPDLSGTPLIQPVTRTPMSEGATPAPPQVTLAAPSPSGPLARPNGPIVLAQRVIAPPVINGDLSDWPGLPNPVDQPVFRPENWHGPADLSAHYALSWDAQNLYLAAQVTDDTHVQTQHGATLYQGDSLEILLDVDLGGDFSTTRLDADDFQIGLSPGALTGDGPEAYLWFPVGQAGPLTGNGFSLAAQGVEAGYRLEAALPWSSLHVTPAAGLRLGFVLSASDNDTPGSAEQQKLLASVATRRLTDPTSWGTLELQSH